MKVKKHKNYFLLALLFIIGLGVYFLFIKKSEPEYEKLSDLIIHNRKMAFAPSSKCIDCHRDVYEQHIKTAHYLTSALADTNTVKGSFSVGENTYHLNDNIFFKMIKNDTALFEEIHYKNKRIASSKIDIVIGSGTKGQSYLTWKDSLLFQLQIAHFTPTDKWTNSPGMPNRLRRSRRPIFGDCLECHATFAKSSTNYMDNSFSKKDFIFGIDCQRCHNPAQTHVSFHEKNPTVEKPHHIVLFDTLTRQKRLDACIMCHSGLRGLKKPPFSFLTGDNLADFSFPPPVKKEAYPDVHGNQYQLLTMSECFKQTKMDCMTCHNPHINQKGNMKYFNNKCLECHTAPTTVCKEKEEKRLAKNNNCVNCHMPLLPSKVLKVEVAEGGKTTPLMVRTHHIKSYVDSLIVN